MSDNYNKGFLVGAVIGGAAGALAALLLAPKSGEELRADIKERSNEYYGKASKYFGDAEETVSEVVRNTVNQGKERADAIVTSAKEQAQQILSSAENVLNEAKSKASQAKGAVQDQVSAVKEAARAGVEAYKEELKNS